MLAVIFKNIFVKKYIVHKYLGKKHKYQHHLKMKTIGMTQTRPTTEPIDKTTYLGQKTKKKV